MLFLSTTGDPALDRELDDLRTTLTALKSAVVKLSSTTVSSSQTPPQTQIGAYVRTLSNTFQVSGDVVLAGSGSVTISQSGQTITINVPSSGSSKTTTFCGARVYNSGSISITNSTETALTFDTERYDTDTIHSTSSNTSRLVAPVTGYYHIAAGLEWDAGVGATMLTATMSIRLNGVTFLAASDAPVGVRFVKQDVETVYKLTAGDYVEITVNGSIAVGTSSIINAGNFSPEASISLLGV